MAGKIFISYRRDDSKYQAQKIYEAFLHALPRENVFMDVDTIPLGVNFVKVLEGWVEQCEVLLVLMGEDWANSTDPKTSKRRLDNPKDFVRVEIRGALTRDIPVVPVLLDGAEIPDEAQLPDDIKGLLNRNAEFIEYRTFDADVQRLIRKLGVGGSAKQTAAPAIVVGTLRDQIIDRSIRSSAGGIETQGDPTDKARKKRILGTEWTKRGITPMVVAVALLAATVIGGLVFWSPGPLSDRKAEVTAGSVDNARLAAEAHAADAEKARQAVEAKVADAEKARQVAEAKAAEATDATAKSEQARQAAEAKAADTEKARQAAAAKVADAEKARQVAEAKAAEATAATTKSEQARQAAEAKAADVEKARLAAAVKAYDAEKAQRAAEAKADDAEKARRAAEARASDADKARQVAETNAAQALREPDVPVDARVVYTAWTKLCSTPGQNGQDANASKVCATMRDGRTETGIPVVSTVLIEPDGVPKKIFRVTVRSPVQLQYGMRIIVDSSEPATSQFFTCVSNHCMSDYDGTPDLIAKLKKGQMLLVQAINLAGKQIEFSIPLAEFARVNVSPPAAAAPSPASTNTR